MMLVVTAQTREAAFHGAMLAWVVFPAMVALLVAFAHRVAPVRFPLATIPAADDAESIVESVLAARRLFSEAQRMDDECRAVNAYFARYSAHAANAAAANQSTIGASELRRRAVAILASVVAVQS